MSEIAETAFRKLRIKWFDYNLFSYGPEREWEDEDRSEMRVLQNKECRIKFDQQTEEILGGINRCIAPTCEHDMWR